MRKDIAHEVAKTFWFPIAQTRSTEGKKTMGQLNPKQITPSATGNKLQRPFQEKEILGAKGKRQQMPQAHL